MATPIASGTIYAHSPDHLKRSPIISLRPFEAESREGVLFFAPINVFDVFEPLLLSARRELARGLDGAAGLRTSSSGKSFA
jgi:hypothetical protein